MSFIKLMYVVLFIVLVCFLIYLIYASHEYRDIEPINPNKKNESSDSDTSKKCIEHFGASLNPILSTPTIPIKPLPPLATLAKIKFNLYDYNKLSNNLDKSYVNLNSEINNRDVTADNIANIKLHDKITKNLIDTQTLLNMRQNIADYEAPQQYPIDKLIKTIKSKYNAQQISTYPYDKAKYGILANDKCLTVNGLCKEPFCLLACQKSLYSSDSQKFKTERITNQTDAAKSMGTTRDKVSTKNIYPFNVFKSLVNSDCLTLTKDGITVEPCNLNDIKQQWEISPDENKCVLK